MAVASTQQEATDADVEEPLDPAGGGERKSSGGKHATWQRETRPRPHGGEEPTVVASTQQEATDADVEEPLDLVAEAEWKRLRRQIELTAEFWLAFLFSASADKARVLRRRAAQMLGREGRSFVLLEPARPEELAGLSAVLLGPNVAHAECVWVEALQQDPVGFTSSPWGAAWNELVLRLNERRDSLRRHLPGGLVLAGPSEIKPHIRETAPDLWSVRSLVLDLFQDTGELPSAMVTVPLTNIIDLDGFVTANPKMQQILQTARTIAASDEPLLVEGETGTGKGLLARFIHKHSRRASGPFVEVNCAAIPQSLIDSELFGHERGAFTGATTKQGLFQAAHGGTLVLDEVHELPIWAQVALLHPLDIGTIRHVGGTKEITVDVRVISTTNSDLESMIAAGKFREDVFFRLSVFRLKLPPLRERSEDIRLLATRFLARLSKHYRTVPLSFSSSALDSLEKDSWPGNARQLHNAIQAATARAIGEGLSQIERRHIFPERPASGQGNPFDMQLTLEQATRRFQEQFVRRTLDSTDWNVSEAAKRLGLARSHVYSLMKAYGIGSRGH